MNGIVTTNDNQILPTLRSTSITGFYSPNRGRNQNLKEKSFKKGLGSVLIKVNENNLNEIKYSPHITFKNS